ncbi:hypothetical protein BO71DRAFT_187779 [Aspergillus ellipticus CBS 707.79]|uniref:Uncharacterized protein n=1 Tax=Aspergillus ellipticus CBS 707.79 TaxID=1448320 RepID=A0A319DFD4_9EURO|nr:hypothetical protein BO71DRAFT_187779 [Aspergillus ellipticus CBS 707.79]
MAFRLPPQVSRRRPSYSNSLPPPALDTSALSQLPENEATEWVLFSPTQQPSITARTHTTSTDRTPRTQGVSPLSDFGSFGTTTRSAVGPHSEVADDALDEPLDDDGTELDSLDDGLHAFRAPSLVDEDQGAPVALPAHDGLGSFQASSQTVQNQLWQHEQYNPHRRSEIQPRRRSSVQRQLDSITNEEEADVEKDRWQRIEKWRMEQSRVLLQEIEKATRRRRDSRASGISDRVSAHPAVSDVPDGVLETLREPESSSTAGEGESEDESLWQRITRKVIQDLIGIDDSLLSVLFGESLPDDEHVSSGNDHIPNITEALNQEIGSVPEDHPIWQTKVLQRIAHELGILVNQLCEHPGAFTSYLNMSHEIPNQYAGIPLDRVPEEADTHSTAPDPTTLEAATNADSVMSPHFSPTLGDPSGREHAAQWGIEDDDYMNHPTSNSSAEVLSETTRAQHDKEYWERELDVMMVFRYVRNRFTHRGSNNDPYHSSPRRAPQDASRRAAIIRQHHPLVARAHSRSQAQIRRQSQYASHHSGTTGVTSPILRQHFRRPSSSCASQSAKLSAISSRRTLTGSSRNYWDIGGSVDSGSAVALVAAGLGAWGEV